jgi:peptide/nickel transport system substrate-binding protein
MTYVYFNTSHGATADPAVREALIHAYNYQEALDRFRGGAGTLADGPLSTTLPCRPDLPEVSYDPEGAKKILEEAGITDLSLTMRYQSAFAEQTQEATLFQSNLQDIGVDMQLEPIAFADYLTSLQSPETTPEVFLATDSPPFPDAGVVLTQSFASDAVGTNRAAYSNPEVDALLEQSSGEPDADARCAVYEEVQEIIAGDFAVMPLYNVDMPVAHSDGVTDVDAWAPNANPAFQEYRVAP